MQHMERSCIGDGSSGGQRQRRSAENAALRSIKGFQDALGEHEADLSRKEENDPHTEDFQEQRDENG